MSIFLDIHIRHRWWCVIEIDRIACPPGISDLIGDIHIEKIRDAYPVYKLDYEQKLNAAINNIGKFENLHLAGRTALFWYNNMDGSIENGLDVIDNIVEKENESLIIGK